MGIKEDIITIDRQFISLKSLINLICQIDRVEHKDAARWLLSKKEALSGCLVLVREDYYLAEYSETEYADNYYDYMDFLQNFIKINYLREGSYNDDEVQKVGLTKQRILHALKNAGLNIPEYAFKEVESFLPRQIYDDNGSTESNNVCAYLINELACTQAILKIGNTAIIAQGINPENQTATTINANTFMAIMNPQHPYYAPDLAFSIQFWVNTYMQNPKNDSHNNRANIWIKNNTPYSGEQDDNATRRIREIAAPVSSWHATRKKLLNDNR